MPGGPLAQRLRRGAGPPIELHEQPQWVEDGLEGSGESGVAGQGDERAVESKAVGDGGGFVTVGCSPLKVRDGGHEPLHPCRGGGNAEVDGEVLEVLAEGDDLVGVLEAERDHPGADAGDADDESVVLEVAQGLTQGGTSDAEFIGETLLPDMRPRCEITPEDAQPQGVDGEGDSAARTADPRAHAPAASGRRPHVPSTVWGARCGTMTGRPVTGSVRMTLSMPNASRMASGVSVESAGPAAAIRPSCIAMMWSA
ncbi:Uncharacterised protein [Mycobacteroides abscessus subsp. abscessus]|nr:Uncharacterised protein [Mycobacteroides abscessus subsp. abscessus]